MEEANDLWKWRSMSDALHISAEFTEDLKKREPLHQ